MTNLIADVPGLKVGAAQDLGLASGVSVVVFDAPATVGLAAPAARRRCATRRCSPRR